jgi:hypothetical protein
MNTELTQLQRIVMFESLNNQQMKLMVQLDTLREPVRLDMAKKELRAVEELLTMLKKNLFKCYQPLCALI